MTAIPASRLPVNVESVLRQYAFNSYVPQGAFCYDTVAQWRDVTDQLNMAVRERVLPIISSDKALLAEELTHMEKGQVCWRLTGKGRLTASEHPIHTNTEQARWLAPYFKRKGREYVAALRAMDTNSIGQTLLSGEVILNAGKGAPFWFPGSDQLSGLLIAAATRRIESFEELRRWCRTQGNGWDPVITSYSRIQAARKEQPYYEMVGGRLQEIGTFWAPKVRAIKAVPFIINWRWAGVAHLQRELLRKIRPSYTGDTKYVQELIRRKRFAWASDLSAYDDSVSKETLDAYRSHVLAPLLKEMGVMGLLTPAMVRWLLEADAYVNTAPILAPPIREMDGAELVPSAGGIKSGERLTALKGTDINDDRIAARAKTLGLRIEWANFGDDTVIASDSDDAARWFEAKSTYGFEEEPADDVSFLMRRMPHGYAYFCRMLYRSVNREVAEEPQTIATAALGLRVRYELLNGHPAQHEYFHCLEMAVSASDRFKDAVRTAATSTLQDLLTIVAVQQNILPKGSAGISREEMQRLGELLGRETIDEITVVSGGLRQMRTGMAFGDFMTNIAAMKDADALRTIHARVGRRE